MQWKAIDRNSQDYITAADARQGEVLQDSGCESCKQQLELYDEITPRSIIASNPLFKEIIHVPARLRQTGHAMGTGLHHAAKMAFDHYFGPNAKSPI